MFKNKAIMVAVILAVVALFVVITTTSVFVDDSKQRYGEMTDKKEPVMDDEAAMTPAPAKEESTDTMAESDTATAPAEDTAAAPAAEPTEEAAPAAEPTEQAADSSTQPASSGGEIHIVKAVGLKYEPMVVEIQPGDTVAWENMPTHDTQSLEGLIPADAEYWHSPLGENFQRTFSVEGIYVYKCTPHFGAGMGGAVIVGKPVNLDQIKAADAKGAAGRLVRKALAAAEKM